MKITITRSFERTRQIADFVPIKAYCEASAQMEVDEVVSPEGDKLLKKVFENLSIGLDELVRSEVDKTLASYYPTCIVCGARGQTVNLNKEGVCGQCVSKSQMEARQFSKDAAGLRAGKVDKSINK